MTDFEHLLSPTHECHRLRAVKGNFTGPFLKTVSVVISSYNASNILAKTLAGLQLQTYPSSLVEVVVSDDGSTDQIEDVIAMHKTRLQLRFLTHTHQGYRLATVRNRGILAARNEIIVQIDCDMLPLPNFLEEHLRWFHVGSRLATIGSRKFVDTSGISPDDVAARIGEIKRLPSIASSSNDGKTIDKRLPQLREFPMHPYPYNCFYGGNVAFERETALEAGLYDEAFNGNWSYEDIEFGYRLHKLGVVLVFEPRALALHQENEVVSLEQRIKGHRANRPLLFQKVPGLREFRKDLEMLGPQKAISKHIRRMHAPARTEHGIKPYLE